VAAVQYTFTHIQYTVYGGLNTHKNYKEEKTITKKKIIITRKNLGSKLGSAGRAPMVR
jgi:hypothetical protein